MLLSISVDLSCDFMTIACYYIEFNDLKQNYIIQWRTKNCIISDKTGKCRSNILYVCVLCIDDIVILK